MPVCVSEKVVIEQVPTDPYVEPGHELESGGQYASKANIEWLFISFRIHVCEQFEYESSAP